MTAMADLTDGTQVRHLRWGSTGVVRVAADRVPVVWKGAFAEDAISDEGPVRPQDVEIIRSAS